MENELNELIAAWRVCQDASPKLDPKLRLNAYNFIESFKTTSTHTLEIGFYLATNEEAQQWQLVHFGHQLIMHTIKTKWNEMNLGVKSDVKSRILSMLSPSNRVRPSYLNNSLCLLLIELIKREWPQNWPTLLNDLVELSNRSLELKKLVFIVLKYIAEEFIDTEVGCTAQLPAQRRKDINQYLSSNMESLFGFYLECLEYCYGVISSNSPQNDQVLQDLTNTCLDSLSFYITWLNINLILSRNYSMVNILLNLLSNQKLCVNAAKCLVGLANRKGTNTERMPLLGLFSESVMQQLLNCTKMSLDTSQTKELMKHLVQILVGMGGQLNYLWQSSTFDQRPSEIRLYLNAIYELMQAPNGMHSLEAINLINTLLQNEFITQDADFQQLVSTLSQISSNSYLLIKFSYATMKEYFDDETEYSKFAQRYRADLSKMIRLSASLNPQAFLKSGIEWALKIISECEKLPSNDLTGYDPSSFLYVGWDSLVYLWNNLIQAFTKNLNKLDPADFKSKLLSLVSYSVQLKCRNANYASFNYSFMNALLNLTCDLCDNSERELILKTIIEKLFQDFDQFKIDINNADVTPIIRQKIFNVRRQICASMLNICKSHSKALVPFMNPIFNRIMEIIGQQESTTQMERSILIQALFFCSNESQSYDLQLSLIKQFITPIFEFFETNKDSLANVDSFIQLIGLDDPINSAQGINNRRQIFFYVNCLFGILKSINFLPMPCQTLSKPDESTHHHFIAIFPHVLDLLRCFNQIHSSTRVNREYLGMTEAIKSGVVLTGQNQEKHQQNELMAAEQHSAERILMFICHTYETLNQLIALYLSKLKDKLLLIEFNQSGQEFIYKFGECVLSSLSDLPPFRIRSIIRYVLKTCLTVVNFDREIMQRNVLLVKLNQVLFEYFLPCVLAKINELNTYYKNLGLSSHEDQQHQDLSNNKQLQTQIAEENQFVLMSREFVDLIRVFFNFNNQSAGAQTASTTTANEGGEDIDDENEVMMENREQKEASNNQAQFSELAINLLQTNKVIYQTLILLIFDGLNWPDSQCCFKLIHIGSSLVEKFPISQTETPSFTLHMNPQIAQQIFTCCLTALQQHGEHQDAASHLTNLALLVYDRSPQAYRQEVYYRVLEQIPNVNKRSLDEFTVKSSAIDVTSPRKTALTNQEKMRKDTFKKMLQPIVGKSLGQLYKQEIRIRVLEPLNLKTKRRMNAEDELKNGSAAAEVNICSLFDPANKE